jgi:hypothetical protein
LEGSADPQQGLVEEQGHSLEVVLDRDDAHSIRGAFAVSAHTFSSECAAALAAL